MARPIGLARPSRYRLVSQVLWTPLNLGSALVAWWDPTQGLTMNGSTVSAWQDRVGGFSVSNATASQQPGVSTYNGLQALSFPGGNILSGSGPVLAQPVTGVSAFVTSSASQTPYARTYNFSSGILLFTRRTDQADLIDIFAGNNTKASAVTAAASTGFVSVAAYSGTSSYNYLDGTAVGPLNPGTQGLTSTLMFSSTDNSNESFRGLILDQLFGGALTTSQSNKMQGWLAWRWGLQGKLPSGHPYKSRAPYVSDP